MRDRLRNRQDQNTSGQTGPSIQPAIAPGRRTLTMGIPGRATSSRAPVQRQRDPACEALQMQRAAETARWMDTAMRPDLYPAPVQRQAERAVAEQELPEDGGGRAMPEAVQAKMEGAFGTDFSAVQIHEGPRAAALGARAYTQGADIHFAPGEYQPNTQGGQELLGHELTHVVQQSQGRVRAMRQMQGVVGNDDAGLEREADEMGARAARGKKSATEGLISTEGALPSNDGISIRSSSSNPLQFFPNADINLSMQPSSSIQLLAGDQQKDTMSATDIARSGLSGNGDDIPYRSTIESYFDTDLSHIRSHQDSATQVASSLLGAYGYQLGDHIGFIESNPSPSVVVHEVQHALDASNPTAPSPSSTEGEQRANRAMQDFGQGQSRMEGITHKPQANLQNSGKQDCPALFSLGIGGGRHGGGINIENFISAITRSERYASVNLEYEMSIINPRSPWKIPFSPFLGLRLNPGLVAKVNLGSGATAGNSYAEFNASVEGRFGVGIYAGIPGNIVTISCNVIPTISVGASLKYFPRSRNLKISLGRINFLANFSLALDFVNATVFEVGLGTLHIGNLSGLEYDLHSGFGDSASWNWSNDINRMIIDPVDSIIGFICGGRDAVALGVVRRNEHRRLTLEGKAKLLQSLYAGATSDAEEMAILTILDSVPDTSRKQLIYRASMLNGDSRSNTWRSLADWLDWAIDYDRVEGQVQASLIAAECPEEFARKVN